MSLWELGTENGAKDAAGDLFYSIKLIRVHACSHSLLARYLAFREYW